MAWSRAFDDPIRVSGGRVQEAGHYARRCRRPPTTSAPSGKRRPNADPGGAGAEADDVRRHCHAEGAARWRACAGARAASLAWPGRIGSFADATPLWYHGSMRHAQPKKRGPRSTEKGTQVQVRIQPALLAQLDTWKAKHRVLTRPEAIRRLVEMGLWPKRGV